jgi:hypothetical protein
MASPTCDGTTAGVTMSVHPLGLAEATGDDQLAGALASEQADCRH